MIEIRGLTKSFKDKKHGSKLAVNDISFSVSDGEVFGLLGPNGAGKTTTLRMLATLLKPTAGTATLSGSDIVSDAAGVRRKIGMMSGDMGLYARLTPREVIRFFAQLHEVPDERIKARMAELFQTFDMESFADSRIDKLSTGMRQRAAICRTVIHDPPILILDEPTAGLDVPTAQIVEKFVLQAKKTGKCILYSTHVMEEAEYLCDRIAVIHQGKLRICGTMDELRQATGKQRLREIFLALLDGGEER